MNTFKTRELSLAALLLNNNIKLHSIKKITPESYIFVFEEKEICEELEEEFVRNKHWLLTMARDEQ